MCAHGISGLDGYEDIINTGLHYVFKKIHAGDTRFYCASATAIDTEIHLLRQNVSLASR